MDYVRDSAPGFFWAQEADAEDAAAAAATAAAEVGGAGGTGGVEPAPPPQGASTVRSRGLMREWCSFVSLYKVVKAPKFALSPFRPSLDTLATV